MESWGKAAESFLHVLEGLPAWGVLLISFVVGLGLLIVLIGHFGGLYQGRRADQQSLDVMDRLIGQVDVLSNRELALRATLERVELEADTYRLRAVEFQADAELMRVQLRRLIDTVRAVKDGRILPSAITDADIAEVLK